MQTLYFIRDVIGKFFHPIFEWVFFCFRPYYIAYLFFSSYIFIWMYDDIGKNWTNFQVCIHLVNFYCYITFIPYLTFWIFSLGSITIKSINFIGIPSRKNWIKNLKVQMRKGVRSPKGIIPDAEIGESVVFGQITEKCSIYYIKFLIGSLLWFPVYRLTQIDTFLILGIFSMIGLISMIIHDSIPPAILFLSTSNEDSFKLLETIHSAIERNKVVSLIDYEVVSNFGPKYLNRFGNEVRTFDDNSWHRSVIDLLEISPNVVIDARHVSEYLLIEIDMINNLNYFSKTIFITPNEKPAPLITEFQKNLRIEITKLNLVDESEMEDEIKKLFYVEKKL